ncbi:MAG: chloride channel protein [Gemmatimonadaceae bacterium]
MTTSPADQGVVTRVTRWFLIVVPLAFVVGSAVAFFLWSLNLATITRQAHSALLWFLPVGGAAVGWMYWRWGKTSDAGTRLIIDEIHQPGGGIPARMAPLVLFGTLITHLFGGSAGREGTAVQMGGALASAFERNVLRPFSGKALQFGAVERQELLQAGIAAGFGAVFGTPFTGAVFAIEVLTVRRFGLFAVLPCLLAAFVGHWTVALWRVHHTAYPHVNLAQLGLAYIDFMTLGKVVVAAIAFGLASWLFLFCAHGISALSKKFVRLPWLRPAIGGCLVIALTYVAGTRDYLGLGVTSPTGGVSIVSSFQDGGAEPFSWLIKTVFTTVTVGTGFKGGEVTPLFFVGATLGNTMAGLLHGPAALFAALGFVAVFGAAANTPVACTIMGLELFGVDAAIYMAIACSLAFFVSGRKGLYGSRAKVPKSVGEEATSSNEEKSVPARGRNGLF